VLAKGLAIALAFACWNPSHNTSLTFSVAINGVFYNTKHPRVLASFVFWDGKILGAFPSTETRRRGGLVCYKDGYVEAGYFTVNEKGELLWNGKKPSWEKVKWAISGGGLFLLDGKPVRGVGRLENLSSYIVNHPRYSYILVHKDRRTVTIGVSNGTPPYSLVKRFVGEYYAFLRLDGGGATASFRNRSIPRSVHNAIGFPKIPNAPANK